MSDTVLYASGYCVNAVFADRATLPHWTGWLSQNDLAQRLLLNTTSVTWQQVKLSKTIFSIQPFAAIRPQ
jgi:hypothetical protein